MTAPLVAFAIDDIELKWSVVMADLRVSVLSDEAITATVRADSGGRPVNPLSYVNEWSFTPTDANPGTWIAGYWDVSVTGNYRMCINSGASGAALALGEYFAWTRVDGGGESVRRQPGMVIVQ